AVEGVKTETPTSVTANGSVLHGSLEPNGYDAHWQFKCWMLEVFFTDPTLAIPSPAADAGSASGSVPVQEAFTTLSNGDPVEGNTKMSCRLVASNALGTDEGSEVQFTTPSAAPVIEGGAEGGVTSTSAGV